MSQIIIIIAQEYIYYCTGKPNILDFIKYLPDKTKYINNIELALYRKIQSNTRPLNDEVMIYRFSMLKESPKENTINIGK